MPSPSPTDPTTLLPSPFPNTPDQIPAPSPVQATTASIYAPGQDPEEPPLPPQSTGHDEEEVEEDEEDDDYPELQEDQGESLLPPQPFHPFFTLINDATNGETYHPATYYVFADDDPDVLTTATLHALEAQSLRYPEDEETVDPRNHGDEERYLVVDMHEDGTRVKEIKSLSSKWAVTGAEIRGAPTFQQEGGAVGEVGAGNEGLMLMIEGMGMDVPVSGSEAKDKTGREMAKKARARELLEEARKRGQGDVIKGMEELAVGVGGSLGILDKIVGVGE
ncbi:ubiquitin-protein transferase [Venturia nashicola]|nr:ubiquitin-protein transferase [Venturia nashicola]